MQRWSSRSGSSHIRARVHEPSWLSSAQLKKQLYNLAQLGSAQKNICSWLSSARARLAPLVETKNKEVKVTLI